MRKLDIVEIAKFCKEQLKKVCNVEVDILKDNILSRVKDIILKSYDIEYDSLEDYFEFVYPILQNIRLLKLENVKLDIEGYSIEKYEEEYIEDVKSLIAMYFIKQRKYFESLDI